jgi:hypothetical protein
VDQFLYHFYFIDIVGYHRRCAHQNAKSCYKLGVIDIVRDWRCSVLIEIGLEADWIKAAGYAAVNTKVPNLNFFGLLILKIVRKIVELSFDCTLEARSTLTRGSGRLTLNYQSELLKLSY